MPLPSKLVISGATRITTAKPALPRESQNVVGSVDIIISLKIDKALIFFTYGPIYIPQKISQ